mmetsp:Transcript_25887/g.59761  ORF Transcript_25887/g.59761 Transcript_25887/m.59761 type:complete len:209 (+) Transcript_25887:108-734(+)
MCNPVCLPPPPSYSHRPRKWEVPRKSTTRCRGFLPPRCDRMSRPRSMASTSELSTSPGADRCMWCRSSWASWLDKLGIDCHLPKSFSDRDTLKSGAHVGGLPANFRSSRPRGGTWLIGMKSLFMTEVLYNDLSSVQVSSMRLVELLEEGRSTSRKSTVDHVLDVSNSRRRGFKGLFFLTDWSNTPLLAFQTVHASSRGVGTDGTRVAK